MFFLVYHGKGYTFDSVGSMALDELNQHSRLLVEQLKKEHDAHQEALSRARAQAKTGRRR